MRTSSKYDCKVFGKRDAERLSEYLRPVVRQVAGIGEQLQAVQRPQRIEHAREQALEIAKETAHPLDPEVERQLEREEDGLLEVTVVDRRQHMLRLRGELGRCCSTGIVSKIGVEMRVRDVVLEDLVDEVDMRHR